MLELVDCRDEMVGPPGMGLSSEKRKPLTIGVEVRRVGGRRGRVALTLAGGVEWEDMATKGGMFRLRLRLRLCVGVHVITGGCQSQPHLL